MRRIEEALRESRVAAARPFPMEVAGDMAADLHAYLPLMRLMSDLFGEGTELLMLDLRAAGGTTVAVANSRLTGRRVGDPATATARGAVAKARHSGAAHAIDLEERAGNGALLRSSLLFLRDARGEIAATIAVNLELQRMVQARELFIRLARAGRASDESAGRTDAGAIPWVTTSALAASSIDAQIAASRVHVHAMSSTDRLRIVRVLHGQGVFAIRGAVPQVAAALDVSTPSIYRYLGAIRTEMPTEPDGEHIPPNA